MDWKSKLFTAGFAAIAATRADRWLRGAAQGSGVILTFHRVRPWHERSFAPNRFLEVTPEFLDRVITLLDEDGFDVVALDEVPARLEVKRAPRPFAALTFDDGYRDNLDYAWPVLKRHGVPWTLFIVSGFVDRRGRLWWLELEEAIARLDSLEIILNDVKLVLNTPRTHEKYAAYDSLCRRLKMRWLWPARARWKNPDGHGRSGKGTGNELGPVVEEPMTANAQSNRKTKDDF